MKPPWHESENEKLAPIWCILNACVGREVSIVREVKIMEAKLRDRASWES